MRVLHLCRGADTGGQAIRMTDAINRHLPGWEARQMVTSDNYIHYPRDLVYDAEKARELYEWADVVHHHNSLALYPVLDEGQRKPAVLHHHGTRLRDNGRAVTNEGKSVGAVQIVSTVDLLADCPGSTWMPSPHDMDWIGAKYGGRRKKPVLRFSHAPTARRAKGTDTILAALNRLGREYDFVLDMIEQVEWRVCLSRKSISHVFIDQITWGYGNNAIEAWALGLPVISGFDEPVDEELFYEATGESEMPFYRATATDIEVRLREIIESQELRDEWARKGEAFARRWHDEKAVAERLRDVYENTPASKGPKGYQQAPLPRLRKTA